MTCKREDKRLRKGGKEKIVDSSNSTYINQCGIGWWKGTFIGTDTDLYKTYRKNCLYCTSVLLEWKFCQNECLERRKDWEVFESTLHTKGSSDYISNIYSVNIFMTYDDRDLYGNFRLINKLWKQDLLYFLYHNHSFV